MSFVIVSACDAEKGKMPAFMLGRLGTVNKSALLRQLFLPL